MGKQVCGSALLLLALALLPGQVCAGHGAYVHGYGIKSLGFGGMGFVLAEDTYTLSSNPAGAIAMGDRYDIGIDYESPHPRVRVRDNALGRDEEYGSSARSFPIPQVGIVTPISERASLGATAFFAGLGTDYRDSPYERFGGDPRVTLSLVQAGTSVAMGFLVAPKQSLGVALNLSYQEVDLKGAGVFAAISQDREHFSNQGKEGGLGVGLTLGWLGQLTPELLGALSYRTKTFSQRLDDYAGLLPDRGRFDFPAIFGGGLSWEFTPGWMAAIEFQRVLYSSETATGNKFVQLLGGEKLGSADGPGFGWNNQNIYKLGLAYEYSDRLILRAGFSYATLNIPPSQTLLSALAPSFAQRHYTLGATLRLSADWETSAYIGASPKQRLQGSDSIPPLAGGGELDITVSQYFIGFSFGRTFGD
ncbi:MAG: OmpP1/FadL family transporter [Panacagrimonas sp.]